MAVYESRTRGKSTYGPATTITVRIRESYAILSISLAEVYEFSDSPTTELRIDPFLIVIVTT